MNSLKIEGLYKSIKKKEILCGIDLSLKTGVYGLVGPNGAGKTTLFRCITALYDFHYEALQLNDNSVADKQYPFHVGYLPQAFQAFRDLSVEEMLQFFSNMKKLEKDKMQSEIDRALMLTNLTEQRDKKVKAISGGMLRRLGIAQAILGSPDLVLLDEPTVGLDPEERRRFWNIVNEQGKHSIVILSTHIIDDVRNVCDNIIIMNEGKICVCDNIANINSKLRGHVYLYNEEELKTIQGRYEAVDYKGKIRVVTEQSQTADACEPEIEDSYICYIKKLNLN